MLLCAAGGGAASQGPRSLTRQQRVEVFIIPEAGGNRKTGYILKEICTQLGLFFLSDFSLVQYEHCRILGSCLSMLELFVISGAVDAVMISPLGGVYRHMLTQLNGNREQRGPQWPGEQEFAPLLDGAGARATPVSSGRAGRAVLHGSRFESPQPLPAWP